MAAGQVRTASVGDASRTSGRSPAHTPVTSSGVRFAVVQVLTAFSK